MKREDTFCPGCAVPLANRVTLPKDWNPDDGIPEGTTVHIEGGSNREFVLTHQSHVRVYL